MGMELISISIEKPTNMTKEEAVRRAKELMPCNTGGWDLIQEEDSFLFGNLDCEAGFYGENPDGGKYGPDDGGVIVIWETP